MSRIAATLGYFALAFAFGGGSAWACGGFFCQTQPIDQAGEKVIFGVDQDQGELVAIIQIQYTGSAENFSWVIPTPVVPTVGVSSDELFQRLGPPTRPQFRLKYKTEGTCREGGFGGIGTTRGAVSPSSTTGSSGGVQVISQERVGPFDATVLLPDDSEALVKWLKQNDYRIPDTFGPLSDPYVRQKNYFVALKLQSDKDTGDLRPVVLRMKERYPCVPIRLTAIAATENMPVILWVFGKSRAIPSNYLHVKLNEALIDWVGAFGGPAPNYDAVVTQSMREAGGNGFVTDYAGSSSALKGALGSRYDTARLAGISDPKVFMQEVAGQGFPRGGLMQNILRDYLPLPQEVQAQGVAETTWWWNGLFIPGTSGATESHFVKFDSRKFAADLDTTFVQPLKEANDFIDRMPYLTRLYTTMSPKDMENKDPLFAFNSKLGDVSNIHEADATVLCSANYYQWEAPYRIKLQDGTEFTLEKGDGVRAYSPLALTSMPAAFRIEQLAEESDTTLVTDNKPKIDEILRNQPAPQAGAAAKSADYGALGCACRPPGAANRMADAPGSDMEAALWGVTLGSLVWWRRRRKP